ncbi:hypothetical protein Slin15195_G106560 [Septoria linicola]|uniref:Uncharacterized protein n=1 Tax=Septoria linicola TaxID=215465 RepID=A0A9Q9AWS7_9PEZI|nr:hypothetical protein Slin14017_G069530 [Septoria linicola]USW57337.1 hypothetical protein Slin15195_G106560 [Septoria linicola]
MSEKKALRYTVEDVTGGLGVFVDPVPMSLPVLEPRVRQQRLHSFHGRRKFLPMRLASTARLDLTTTGGPGVFDKGVNDTNVQRATYSSQESALDDLPHPSNSPFAWRF